MNQAQALFRLQTIDLTIQTHRGRLEELAHLLGANEDVVAAEKALAQAEAALAPWRTRSTDLELEIKSVTEKTTNVERRLYSGSVSNPKELEDMQAEVASLKRRRATLEDHLLEAMIEVEEGQAACDAAKTTLSETRAAWEAEQGDLINERDELQQTLADLKEQRNMALGDISEESLQRYNTMRRAKRGHVVAELTDRTCAVCGVSQTTTTIQQLRQGQELVFCGNCGRVLVQT